MQGSRRSITTSDKGKEVLQKHCHNLVRCAIHRKLARDHYGSSDEHCAAGQPKQQPAEQATRPVHNLVAEEEDDAEEAAAIGCLHVVEQPEQQPSHFRQNLPTFLSSAASFTKKLFGDASKRILPASVSPVGEHTMTGNPPLGATLYRCLAPTIMAGF